MRRETEMSGFQTLGVMAHNGLGVVLFLEDRKDSGMRILGSWIGSNVEPI